MGKRQKRWARNKRIWIIEQLGGKCADCKTKDDLQVDHLVPGIIQEESRRGYKRDYERRVIIYLREMREGKLQILCGSCNRKKGKPNYRPNPWDEHIESVKEEEASWPVESETDS